MVKTEEIEKYSGIVKEKYPSTTMRRTNDQKVIWISDGVRVAELFEEDVGLRFKFLQKQDFKVSPFSSL